MLGFMIYRMQQYWWSEVFSTGKRAFLASLQTSHAVFLWNSKMPLTIRGQDSHLGFLITHLQKETTFLQDPTRGRSGSEEVEHNYEKFITYILPHQKLDEK